MKNKELLKMCEASILVALAIGLDQLMKIIPFLNMPNGGHISLSCLALVFIGFRSGAKYGFIGCFVFALVNWLIDGYTLSPWSIILDYVMGFTIFGIAGLFKNVISNRRYLIFGLVLLIANIVRFFASTVSGVVAYGLGFWASAAYNGPYIAASCAVCLVIGILVIIPLSSIREIN